MAPPMTPKQFTTLLDKWHIPWRPIKKDWATHNRNTKGKWGPVNGIMLHHTGSDDQTNMPNILWDGYEGLPGPLCHGGIDVFGTVLLAGWGRCNHAGLGDGDVLKLVASEKYNGVLKPRIANVDGNSRFYGFEIMYSGLHSMSSAQLVTSTRLSAAICTYHGWKKQSVIGHGEWQPGKWDPGIKKGTMMDMSDVRLLVGDAITKGPTLPNPGPVPPVENLHKVLTGETLWGIAQKELAESSRWLEIVKLNPQVVKLVPGEILKMPER